MGATLKGVERKVDQAEGYPVGGMGWSFEAYVMFGTLPYFLLLAAVPIGRVIDTSNSEYPEKEAYWKRQRGLPFSFETCCLEV